MDTDKRAGQSRHSASYAPARIAVWAGEGTILRRIEAVIDDAGHELLAVACTLEELVGVAQLVAPTLVIAVHELEPFATPGAVAALRAQLPGVPVIVVAGRSSGRAARKLLRGEIDGLVLERHLETALAATIEAVLAEQLCVPSTMREQIARPVFSHREKQVLELVAAGMTNGEIAGRLYLSESTVKSHLASSFRKLGVSSRAEAVRRLLDPESGFELAARPAAGGAPTLDPA